MNLTNPFRIIFRLKDDLNTNTYRFVNLESAVQHIQSQQKKDVFSMLDSSYGVYIVLSPNSLLIYRLLREFDKFLTIPHHFLNVYSNDLDSEDLKTVILEDFEGKVEEISVDVDFQQVAQKIKLAKDSKKAVVIFCDYFSVNKAIKAVKTTEFPIEFFVFDEMEYRVSDRLRNAVFSRKTPVKDKLVIIDEILSTC